MANKLVQNLAVQVLKKFEYSFKEAKSIFWNEKKNQILHNEEYGNYRENVVRELFDLVLPNRFGVSNGFVVNNVGDISTQCDIIIFDKTITPNIESDTNQKFYTVESVVGIGEVKSKISGQTALSSYLNKLARIKALREKTDEPMIQFRDFSGEWSPKTNPFDQLFSFLICSDLDFKNKNPSKLKYESDVAYRHRHNLILSIRDGIYIYKSRGGQNIYFPSNKKTNFKNIFLPSDNQDFPSHLKIFLVALVTALNFTTVLRPDMALYLSDEVVRKIT